MNDTIKVDVKLPTILNCKVQGEGLIKSYIFTTVINYVSYAIHTGYVINYQLSSNIKGNTLGE